MTYETYLYIVLATPAYAAFAAGLYRPVKNGIPIIAVLIPLALGLILVIYPYILTLGMADVTYLINFGTKEGFVSWLLSFPGLIYFTGALLTASGIYLATSFFDLKTRLQEPQ